MPHKGFFSQHLVILLDAAVSLDALEDCLKGWQTTRRERAESDWFGSDTSLLIPFRPEVNGWVSVDLFDRRWPDEMGDPQTEPEIFAAWSMGYFGAGAWPDCLQRACEQSWVWPEGKAAPLAHVAFLSVRSSYIIGAAEDAPLWPDDHEPVSELRFVSDIAAALATLPQTICYFNPSGQCVRPARDLLPALWASTEAIELPLDLWCNVRMFKLDDALPHWGFMDTVGMGQLDVADSEACFPTDRYDAGEVAKFLLVASAYLIEHGPVIDDGDTMDGPGGVAWRALLREKGKVSPPRAVLRWLPDDGRPLPASATDGKVVRKGEPRSGGLGLPKWLRALLPGR